MTINEYGKADINNKSPPNIKNSKADEKIHKERKNHICRLK